MLPLIESLLTRPGVTDVLVNSADGIWCDAGQGLQRVEHAQLTEPEVRQLARYLIARGGRHLDDAHPYVDVRAGEGIRVHAVLPPISTHGTLISIRIARTEPWSLDDLVAEGMFDAATCDWLERAIAEKRNVLIAGATGTGKTTLLGALMSSVPEVERIITVEDTAELRIRHAHVVGLETRQRNIEGAGEVGLDELVRQSLRMRPDRIVVGESRGAEFGSLLTALNTGHGGVGTTVHANSIESVPARLVAMSLQAGLRAEVVAQMVVGAFRDVVFLENTSGVRQLSARGQLSHTSEGEIHLEVESSAPSQC